MKKLIIIPIVVVVLGLLAYFIYKSFTKEEAETPKDDNEFDPTSFGYGSVNSSTNYTETDSNPVLVNGEPVEVQTIAPEQITSNIQSRVDALASINNQ